jgi:hypothetical protein
MQRREVTEVQNAIASLKQNADVLRKKAAGGKGDTQTASDRAEYRRALVEVIDILGEAQDMLADFDARS